MKQTIRKLWFEYKCEEHGGLSEEKREILRRLADASAELDMILDEKQSKKLDDYRSAYADLCSFSEYEAFEKGISFATGFLIESGK